MPNLTLNYPSKSLQPWTVIIKFLQGMVNRLAHAYFQYGKPKRSNLYLSRMRHELDDYLRTGNKEHLFNIANYAMLESIEPQHSLYHDDNTAPSSTRHKEEFKP